MPGVWSSTGDWRTQVRQAACSLQPNHGLENVSLQPLHHHGTDNDLPLGCRQAGRSFSNVVGARRVRGGDDGARHLENVSLPSGRQSNQSLENASSPSGLQPNQNLENGL